MIKSETENLHSDFNFNRFSLKMVNWSSLRYLVETCGINDPKHYGLVHPPLSLAATLFASSFTVLWASQKVTKVHNPEAINFCRKFAHFLLAYFGILLGTRLKAEGISAFYDMMWQCNISMVTTAIGLYTMNKQIIGAGVSSVAIDQTLWWIDILSFILTK
jgi:hypothetical protein